MTTSTILNVDLGDRTYPIMITDLGISGLSEHLNSTLKIDHYFLVTDETVADYYLEPVKNALGLSDERIFIIPPGEASKNLQNYKSLCDHFLNNGINRKSAIIALGGGVVGDLAGFAAATIMRGVHYIQVPTTLLAQVDSAVGGKTGINTDAGKNLIGSFYQPQMVYTDIGVLKTLPKRQMTAGYAEILKYALIDDPEFFTWLDQNAAHIFNHDAAALTHAIYTSCAKKADVVARDEREGGVRALLNLGHTFGHALEAIAGYDGSLLHGEAVLIGMDMALSYSVYRGYAPDADLKNLRAHYEAHNLWPRWSPSMGADDILVHMAKDKKNSKDQIVLILMRGIGQTYIAANENTEDIKDFLVQYLKQR